MTLVTRSAILQARVSPEIKYASEKVLRRLGLNMTEVMEMFLRRVIIDQRIPFDVVALSDAQVAQIAKEYDQELGISHKVQTLSPGRRRRTRSKRELKKWNLKPDTALSGVWSDTIPKAAPISLEKAEQNKRLAPKWLCDLF